MLKLQVVMRKPVALQKLAIASLIAVTAGLTGCAQDGSTGIITGALNSEPAAPQAKKSKAPGSRKLAQLKAAYMAAQKSPEAALDYARALRLSGRKKRALAVLDESARHNGKHRAITKNRGFLSLEIGRIADAERHLRQALDPNRPDWRVHSALGSALASSGKQQQAQIQFAKALELKPDHPSILNNLALSYALDGNAKRAETILKMAARSSPEKKRIRQNIVLLKKLETDREPVAVAGKTRTSRRTARRTVKKSAPAANPVRAKEPGKSQLKKLVQR